MKLVVCGGGGYIGTLLSEKLQELGHFIKVIDLFRYGMNTPESILDPLSDVFDVLFISEYEDEYHDLASPDTSVMTFNFQDFHQEQ